MNAAQIHRRPAVLAALALVLAACATTPEEQARQRESADTQLGLAGAYLQQNDQRQALAAAEKAIEMEPMNVNAHMLLGTIHQLGARWGRAMEAYQKALALDPKRAEIYYLMGVVRYEMRDAAGAIELLRKALVQPTYLTPHDAHLYLGGILLDQGKVDDALVEFRKAVDVQPELGEAHNAVGYALLLRGRPEEAVEALARAVRFAPTLVAAYRNLGMAYRLAGKRDEARVTFRRVVELAPPESPLAAEARKALAELGDAPPAPAGATPGGAPSGAPAAAGPAPPATPGGAPGPTIR